MEALGGGEQQVDGIRVSGLEIGDLLNTDLLAADHQCRGEQVFGRGWIQEDGPGLLNNGSEIYKEQKIPVALLVEVDHEPCHQQGLAAAGGHVEQHLAGLPQVVRPGKIGDEILQRRLLIGPQGHPGVQTVPDPGGKREHGAVSPEPVHFLVEKHCPHPSP